MSCKFLCCLMFWLLTGGLLAEDQVNDSGVRGVLPIQGITAFPVSDVSEAIITSPEFIEVSQRSPDARRAKACELLVRGYRAAGYGDARAEPLPNGAISLTEGPRYRAGELRISGASASLQAAIRSELQPGSTDQSSQFKPAKEITKPTISIEKAKPNEPAKVQWKPGELVSFNEKVNENWKAAIHEACDLDGHPGTEITVDLHKEPETQVAHLEVVVTRESPALVVGEFQVDGLQNHSPEEVIEFLKLKPGPCSMLDRQRIEKDLYESGRFYTQKTEIISPFQEGAPTQLLIQVQEAKGVPTLSEPLSRDQMTMMKFRNWMENLADQPYPLLGEDDLFVGLSPSLQSQGAWRYSVIISPRGDLILQLKRTDGPADQALGLVARFSPDRIAIGSHRSRRILQIHPQLKSRPVVMIQLKCEEKVFGEPRSSFRAGVGMSSSSRQKPLLQVSLEPVVLLRSREDVDASYHSENGQLLIESKVAGSRVFIDEQTGRLIEFVVTDKDTPGKARIWTDAIDIETVWQQWVQEYRFDVLDVDDAPITHLVEFLFSEWDTADPAHTATRRGLMKLIRPEFLPALDRGSLGLPEFLATGFSIPSQQAGLSSTVCSLALRMQRNLLRSDSAAASLARTFTVAVANPTPSRLQDLLQQATKTECGPLTCAVFGLGGRLCIPVTGLYFSKLGRSRLTPKAFENDLTQWIDPEHAFGRMLIAVIRRLRELTPEETQGLVELYADQGTRPHLAMLISELQKQSDLPSDELELERFRAAVMRAWEPLIRPGLEKVFNLCSDSQSLLSAPPPVAPDQAVKPGESPR